MPDAFTDPQTPAAQQAPDYREVARSLARELYAFAALGEAEVVTLDEFALPQAGGGGITLAAGQSIQVQATFQGTSRYHAVLVVVPAGATGTLQLGDRVIPVPAGVTTIQGVDFHAGPTAARQLTIAGGGGLAWLELFGTGIVGTGAGVVRTGR